MDIEDSERIGQPDPDRRKRYEQAVLPHLDSAYNLARWLMRNHADAEDVVQEACLRAFRFFGSFRGGDARVWLLAIVRNSCYTWLEKRNHRIAPASFDEERHGGDNDPSNPEVMVGKKIEREILTEELGKLPHEFREVVVLREMEGFSYKEIADVTGIPLGTVMSRLSRGRKLLQASLMKHFGKEP